LYNIVFIQYIIYTRHVSAAARNQH
jgi:hypothetical protein